jgi:hypothetical protein
MTDVTVMLEHLENKEWLFPLCVCSGGRRHIRGWGRRVLICVDLDAEDSSWGPR